MAMNLRSLDLNLLLVFEAILREGSVARAAERLHLSPPATSHALSRLRHRLKDQLFVRTPAGMTPTPRAEQLARPVRRALDELQLALEPDVFSPATAERIFVVALNNFGAIALAAPVVSECLKQAPRIRVSLRPSGTLDVLNFLERGELDLVISALDAPADRFAARTLVVDHYVVVMRRGHPAAKLTMDIEGFPSCHASSSPLAARMLASSVPSWPHMGSPTGRSRGPLFVGRFDSRAVGHGRGARLSDRGGVPKVVSD